MRTPTEEEEVPQMEIGTDVCGFQGTQEMLTALRLLREKEKAACTPTKVGPKPQTPTRSGIDSLQTSRRQIRA